jgi:LPS-assembly protein
VNLGYRAIRDRVEQGEFSTAWPIGDKWNAFGRAVYSLRDDDFLEQFGGFEYKACCYKLRMVGRRFISSRTGEKDTGIYLQLELNGLAGVNAGTDVDAFLQRTIRGYSPDFPARP